MRSILFRTPAEAPSLPAEVKPPSLAPPAGPAPPTQHSRLALIILAVIVIALAAWALVARRRSRPRANTGALLPTAVLRRRDFVRSLRLVGTVEAAQSYLIAGPQISGSGFGNLVITQLAAAGSRVRRGDVLAEFDPQSQIQAYLEARASYQDLEDQVAKSQAAEISARAKDDTDLKQAEDNLQKARLEVLKLPILSRIDVERNKLNLTEAEVKLKQLRTTYALKRQSAAAGIRDLEIQANAKLMAMQQAQQNENKMTIRSPVDGIVVLSAIWKGNGMGQVEVGDQVWNGEPFMQVVNPAVMIVNLRVNQLDAPYIRAGQSAEIRLDAYPQAAFSGSIEKISPLGVPSTYSKSVRTFAAVASIRGSDPRLMPDLSAAVDVQLQRLRGVLVAPRDAIFTQNGREYVMVRKGSDFTKQEVSVGAMNDTQTVVESGLSAGDVVERNVPQTLNSDK